ncbi:MAG: CaiB/BaiF CoA-transferase family protein [Thermaerobacter sp.]|nr:CaiB/BaiF CoA-transferase family protein [Thermaerobacter sp.]
MLPLTGIRVLDLSRLLPGAYASLMLLDLGAEVIKIEEPVRGDYGRWLSPRVDGQSVLHAMINRGKKSLTLNLKHPRGRELFLQLASSADVVLESFRPGVLERLGIGFETLKAISPSIILCSLTGYGQDGPYAMQAGHDINYLGLSGILALNGTGDGTPLVPSIPIADIGGGGQMAVTAIMAGLLERQRTGEGQWLDVSMLDGVVSWLPALVPLLRESANVEQQSFFLSGAYACYTVYATADGRHMSVGILEPKFWKSFCEAMDLAEYLPLQLAPLAVQAVMKTRIQEIFLEHAQAYWIAKFQGVDTCCAPVRRLDEVAADEQVRWRDMLAVPADGGVPRVGCPIKSTGGSRETAILPAPRLGQDTDAMLRGLGVTSAERDQLRRDGVV